MEVCFKIEHIEASQGDAKVGKIDIDEHYIVTYWPPFLPYKLIYYGRTEGEAIEGMIDHLDELVKESGIRVIRVITPTHLE